MSYYILPKINNNHLLIQPSFTDNFEEYNKPFISHSLYFYYKEITEQIENYHFELNLDSLQTNLETVDDLKKIINPYEYIFSKVPGSKFSVSKLKPNSNLFYDILELSITIDLFDIFEKKDIQSLIISSNHLDINDCLTIIRENYDNDTNIYSEYISTELLKNIKDNSYDFIYYEYSSNNNNSYDYSIIQMIGIILRHQYNNGITIIKIDSIFHKYIVDILYILTSLFEKVYVVKPNSNNITSFEKYIVCKNYCNNQDMIEYHKKYYHNIQNILKWYNDCQKTCYITSLLKSEIPYYFLNKLDDMNIIIGQQQLESLNSIINIMKNKNKDDKIELIKKTNIQKVINWCEKFKIPYNKFTDKINIFLPITKSCDKEEYV